MFEIRACKSKLSFFVVLVLADVAILLAPALLTVVAARYFTPQDFGKIALSTMYGNALSPVIMSLLIIGLVIKLIPSEQKTRTS